MNLEDKISDWRRQMLAAGLQAPVPLDELEIHLREMIDQRLHVGFTEQFAFDSAVQEIGQPRSLKTEFRKTERTFMNRKLAILAGIFIVLLGTAFILPALGNHKHHNQASLAAGANYFTLEWAHNEIVGLAWGIPLALGGVATTVYGLKKRKA
jgi:hypothetical protein